VKVITLSFRIPFIAFFLQYHLTKASE